MRIFLHDIENRDAFYPLTTLRNIEDLRVGIFSIKEKWIRMGNAQGIKIEIVNDPSQSDIKIPSNFIPHHSLDLNRIFSVGIGQTDQDCHIHKWWDIIKWNQNFIHNDIHLLHDFKSIQIPEEVQHSGKQALLIHEDAVLDHCFINTTDGPVVIDKGAKIMTGALLRGPLYIGNNAVVKMGAQLYGGSNIGENCIVGGEIKNSVFHANSNKSHHGYIGDSYIGEWCNLGAGTSNSNLKNTASPIRVWNQTIQQFEPGPHKIGMIMGDHVKTAINTSINSGAVLSSFTNIFTELGKLTPKYLPMFSWGLDDGVHYQLDHLLAEISRWMKLKGQDLSQVQKEKIITLYKQFKK